MSTIRSVWLLAVVGLLALVIGSPTSAAAQDDEFATVEISTVGGVPWNDGRRVNGTVTVKTERAISGTLSVVDEPEGGTSTTHEFDIDMAANTTATFPVQFITGWDGVQATAAITSNGETIATDTAQVFGDGSGEASIVAVLGIDDPPRRVAEVGGETQLATLELDRKLGGLESASSLLTTRSALLDLGSDSSELLRVEAWVRGGGQMVVADQTASLDPSYHEYPTANPDRFRYGAGSIVYLEDWESGIPLGGYLGSLGLQERLESQDFGIGATGELALLANVALPDVLLIVGALLVYTLIAGPLLFGVVAVKGVQNRIWVILPALSLVFTVGILGIGLAGRRGATEAHITIVEVNDSGSRATSNLLLTSSFGSNRKIEAPDGWRYLGQGNSGGRRAALLRVGSTSTDITLDMPPGSNALARVSGVASDYDGDLAITNIRLDGDELTAEVVNNGSVDLNEAVALFGNARKKIGFIGAGDRVPFSVAADDSSGRAMKELLLWPKVGQEWGNNGRVAVPIDRDALTAAGAWTEWRIDQGVSSNPDGVVGVVGWTDDLASPIGGIDQGRTALFVRENVPTATVDLGFAMTTRLPNRQGEPVFFENFAGYMEESRVTLDQGYDLDRLALRVDNQSSGLGLLIDGEWRYPDLPGAGIQLLSIPDDAVENGEITIRSYQSDRGWGVGLTAWLIKDPIGDVEEFPFTAGLKLRRGAGFEPQFEEAEIVEFEQDSIEEDTIEEDTIDEETVEEDE